MTSLLTIVDCQGIIVDYRGIPLAKSSDLIQGTLDLLVLKALSREPIHGWGIAKRIEQLSDDVLSVGHP